MLETIHQQGLRLALSFVQTSPIESIYDKAGEPPLNLRRKKLTLNIFLECHQILKLPPEM